MTDMKSAFERAMEKVAKLEKASPEELRRMESLPKGQAMAARYLDTTQQYDLQAELGKAAPEVKKYLLEGIEETLLRNISLPQNDRTARITQRAVSGIALIKRDKNRLKTIMDQLKQVLDYYTQTRQHTYSQYKAAFEQRLAGARKAMEQQTGVKAENIAVNVESQPQFQEEWRRVLGQLNAQYDAALTELKQHIKETA